MPYDDTKTPIFSASYDLGTSETKYDTIYYSTGSCMNITRPEYKAPRHDNTLIEENEKQKKEIDLLRKMLMGRVE